MNFENENEALFLRDIKMITEKNDEILEATFSEIKRLEKTGSDSFNEENTHL